MARRLNFACAVVHRPAVLLLDEPTVGVDPASRELLYREMEAERARGVAILCSTHLVDEAERLAERVVVMRDGRLCGDGPPSAVVTERGARPLRAVMQALGDAQEPS